MGLIREGEGVGSKILEAIGVDREQVRTEMESADLDFIIAATQDNIMMVEGEAKECSEEDLIKALEIAHEAIRIQIKAQQELRDMVGVKEKRDYPKPEQNDDRNKRDDRPDLVPPRLVERVLFLLG